MTDQRRSQWIWALLWAASIFATSSGVVSVGQLAHGVSSVAGGRISETAFRHFWGLAWWMFVKGWHALEFGILYLLCRKAMPKSASFAMLIPMVYAFADEAHQLFVQDRGCRLSDVAIDTVGILALWMVAEWRCYRKGEGSSVLLTPIFQRPYARFLVFVFVVSAIFLMSFFPFGLITLKSSGGYGP